VTLSQNKAGQNGIINLNYEAGQKRLLRFQLGAGEAKTPGGFKERLLGLK